MAANGWNIVLKQLKNVATFDRAVKVGIQSVLAAQKQRIFVEGKAVDGEIGQYSKEPISISKNNQSRNTGKTYFKGGYAEYHGMIGKGSDKVILRNKDQMFFDFAFFEMGNNQYGIGFSNELNYKKSQGQEKHFGKNIFGESDKERGILETVMTAELGKDMQ